MPALSRGVALAPAPPGSTRMSWHGEAGGGAASLRARHTSP
eukprot:COSAG01_NODE_11209_length_1981_cov_4.317216_1_plen_40_part_10